MIKLIRDVAHRDYLNKLCENLQKYVLIICRLECTIIWLYYDLSFKVLYMFIPYFI